MQEEERKRTEHARNINDRASIVRRIMDDVKLYEKAGLIRRYCDTAAQNNLCPVDELTIAMQFADWIDPTIKYTDEILSEEYKPEDFL